MSDERELLDETVLRRALRLEDDERPPRFDPSVIVAAGPVRPAAITAIVGLALVAFGLAAAPSVWSLVMAALPSWATLAGAAVLSLVVTAALLLAPAAELATQPAVPLSLLAALVVAIGHELRERREHRYANAS